MTERDYYPSTGNGESVLKNSKALSPNWNTVEHQRIPFEDALRNGVVLAEGIFGNINPDHIFAQADEKGIQFDPKTLSPREEGSRKLLIGYLQSQGHSKKDVAWAFNFPIEELDAWGWDNPDWLTAAQERAVEILSIEKQRQKETLQARKPTKAEKRRRDDIFAQNALQIVAKAYSVSVDDILSKKRNKELAQPRDTFQYILNICTDYSYDRISNSVNRKDHSTSCVAVGKLRKRVNVDMELKKRIDTYIKIADRLTIETLQQAS